MNERELERRFEEARATDRLGGARSNDLDQASRALAGHQTIVRSAALILAVLAIVALAVRSLIDPLRPQIVLAVLLMAAINLAVAVLPKSWFRWERCGTLVTMSFVGICCFASLRFGLEAPVLVLACVSPLLAAFLVSRRAAIWTAGLMIVYFAFLAFSTESLLAFEEVAVPIWTRFVMHSVAAVLVGALAFSYDRANSRLQARLDREARSDGLTTLANRRAFDEVLLRERARTCRQKEELALVMLDLDFFKKLNDTRGHAAGDECLVEIGAVLRKCVRRATDLPARVGGEEFAALLPSTSLDGAQRIAEAIRIEVQALLIEHPKSPFGHVTVSVGVASVLGHEEEADLRVLADRALYEAKLTGRNRVCVAADSLAA